VCAMCAHEGCVCVCLGGGLCVCMCVWRNMRVRGVW